MVLKFSIHDLESGWSETEFTQEIMKDAGSCEQKVEREAMWVGRPIPDLFSCKGVAHSNLPSLTFTDKYTHPWEQVPGGPQHCFFPIKTKKIKATMLHPWSLSTTFCLCWPLPPQLFHRPVSSFHCPTLSPRLSLLPCVFPPEPLCLLALPAWQVAVREPHSLPPAT